MEIVQKQQGGHGGKELARPNCCCDMLNFRAIFLLGTLVGEWVPLCQLHVPFILHGATL